MNVAARGASSRWLNQVEAETLRRKAELEAEGRRRWDALDAPAQKMALVREIVATRAAELTLAYRNVVAVVAGYRTRRNAEGAEELHAEPCVIFMTREKWGAGESGARAQHLPAVLLAFGPDPGASQRKPARCLYAVPTDVQLAQRHMGAKAHAAAAVKVADPEPAFVLPGSLTCGVRLRGAPSKESRFALSAMHVLSPVPQQTQAVGGAGFTAIAAPGGPRGVSTAWGGYLDADLGEGFDVQLAAVSDRRWFNQAFAPLKLSRLRPYVAGPDLFDELAATKAFRILVHEGQPNAAPGPRQLVQAQFARTVGPEWRVVYDVRWNGKATPVGLAHAELLVLAVHEDCPPPVSGDSGSAVVCDAGDGCVTLVGMYIARGPAGAERDAYVLPAWQLFDPVNWFGRLPAGTVAIAPSFSLP